MKIKFAPLASKALTTTLGGGYIRDTKHGPVVQAKPRFNHGLNKPGPKAWQKRFGFAATMASSPESMQYQTAVEMAKGTEQVPRDILTMAALGNYYIIEREDGSQWGHVVGPTAYDRAERGQTMWEWSQGDAAWTTAMSATAFATKGLLFTPYWNDKFYSTRVVFTGVVNAIWKLSHGTTNAGNVIQTITSSGPLVTTSAGLQLQQFELTSQFQAGVKNFFLLTRTDLLANTIVGINVTSTPHWHYPLIFQGTVQLASKAPVVGNTLSIVATTVAPPFGFLVNQ